MRDETWIGALLLVVASGLAHGQPAVQDARGLYLSAGLGAGYAPNAEFDDAGLNVDFDLARPIGSIALGLDRPGAWRFEVDASYRYNDAEVIFFDAARPDVAPDADSRITALGVALSALRDFDVGGRFQPFLGAGVGMARIDYELRQYITGVELLDDRDTALTYQLIAGVGLRLSPRVDLALEYRYWAAPDIELNGADGSAFDTDHRVQSLTANLHYRLAPRQLPAARGSAKRRGWILRGGFGPTFTKDAEIKENLANFDAFDVGSLAALSVGYRWSPRWVVEFEAARRRSEAELIDFNPEFGEDRASGRVLADSLMANVIYEPAWRLPFQPYALLGVGWTRADWNVRLDGDGSTFVDDDDSAVAFQVAFGASAPLTERVAVSVEYRFWQTALFDMHQPDDRPLRTELSVHALVLGLRFTPGGSP
ncbi:MAG: outer membrane beta-barrel protein [Pseudomonadales bacterium]